ncbi:MAG: helix-turn-helix transcriptional regulator [Sphingomonadales bacterium]|nr:helix-turn-helix transcriptional regulator [Sphingomonadales bacterium]
MLAYNWRINRNSVFLSLLILFYSTYVITYYTTIVQQSRFWIAITYANPSPLWYLTGPCLYFYVRSNLEDQIRFRKSDILHLIPFLICLIGMVPYLITSFDFKLSVADDIIRDINSPRDHSPNWIIPFQTGLILRPSVMIVYCVLSIFSVLRFPDVKERFRAIPENQWRFSRNWMLLLSVVFILASISSLLISIQYNVTEKITVRQMNAGAISLILSISLLMTPVLLIVFPQILYGLPRNINLLNRRTEDKQIAMAPDVFSEQNIAARYAAGQAPDEDPFIELSHRMLKTMEEQKPYLNPEFSLYDLADLLDVPKHHLYYCFQNILHTKFTRLRTAYRIEYSKQLLANTDLRKITLDAVGQQSGFASNSGFYNTFKAEVGCSPGAYAEKHNSTAKGLF